MGSLKLLSLNTWKNDGDYPKRLEAMKRQLKREAPDVALLQEAFRCEETGESTAAFLAESLGMHCRYAPARVKSRFHRGKERRTESGLAVLSGYPIRDSWMLTLPTCDRGDQRIAFACEIDFWETRFLVMAVHFSHLKNDSEMRARQIRTAIDALGVNLGRIPCVIAGDFNCVPDSGEVIESLRGISTKPINVLPYLGIAGATTIGRSSGVERQIDQIWVFKGEHENGVSVRAGGITLDRRDEAELVYPSDHYAVWAELSV